MTKRLDPAKDSGDGPEPKITGLEKGVCKRFDDVLRNSNLFVKRCQDIASCDWGNFVENYERGRMVLYAEFAHSSHNGQQYRFPFIIVRESVILNGAECNDSARPIGTGRTNPSAPEVFGNDTDQSGPMLIGVSNLVYTPQGVIPSGVWAVSFDQQPLFVRKFLFYSIQHPSAWKWIDLPVVHTAEGKAYARDAATIESNNCNDHFIKGGSKVSNRLDNLEADILRRLHNAACHQAFRLSVNIDANGVRISGDVVIDDGFEIVEFALGSSDLFL